MIIPLTKKLEQKTNLTKTEIQGVIADILDGKVLTEQTASFLEHLTNKGETDEELSGILDVMYKYALKMRPKNDSTIIDVCGTGGDGFGTFNVSTTVAFVVAAAGGVVAKHGNRSSSQGIGSADIFEYLGYNLEQSPESVADILQDCNLCFMFAPRFHPAMKNVAAARKRLQKRTAFNLIGPLCNPANTKHQVIGVSSEAHLECIPRLLKSRGAQKIMSVRAENGMDELATSVKNKICTLDNGIIHTDVIHAEKLGLHSSTIKEIQVKTKKEALQSFVSVLDGTASVAMSETVLLNSAAALIVAGISNNFDEGIEMSRNTIENNKAKDLLDRFVNKYGDSDKLDEVREP